MRERKQNAGLGVKKCSEGGKGRGSHRGRSAGGGARGGGGDGRAQQHILGGGAGGGRGGGRGRGRYPRSGLVVTEQAVAPVLPRVDPAVQGRHVVCAALGW